jgi:hypothetical protein
MSAADDGLPAGGRGPRGRRISPEEMRVVERALSATAWSVVATRMAVFTALVYILLHIAAPYMPVPSASVGSGLAIVVFTFLSLLLVYYATRIPLSARGEAAGAAVAVAFWITFAYVLAADLGIPKVYAAHVTALRLAGAHVAMIFAASFVGMLVSRIIRDVNIVLPVAVVAAVVDVLTVLRGPVAKALETAPDLVARVSVGIPQLGTAVVSPTSGVEFVTLMGPGDFVFLGIFMACVWRFRMNAPATLWMIYAFCLIAMLVIVTPGGAYVPGLPFIAAALLLVNFNEFRLSRAERFAMLYAALVGTALLLLLALFSRLSSR